MLLPLCEGFLRGWLRVAGNGNIGTILGEADFIGPHSDYTAVHDVRYNVRTYIHGYEIEISHCKDNAYWVVLVPFTSNWPLSAGRRRDRGGGSDHNRCMLDNWENTCHAAEEFVLPVFGSFESLWGLNEAITIPCNIIKPFF